MPTYVYKFVETGETIEVQQSFTDDTLTEVAHPESGEVMAVKKVFQPVGVTFRGSGFFKTDSRANGGGRTDRSTGGSETATSGESTSSDAKGSTESSSGSPSGSSPASSSSSSSSTTSSSTASSAPD